MLSSSDCPFRGERRARREPCVGEGGGVQAAGSGRQRSVPDTVGVCARHLRQDVFSPSQFFSELEVELSAAAENQ